MEGKCCASVYRGPWSSGGCYRNAKVERNGKLYCGTHDPVRVKEKNDAKMEIYNAKWDRRNLILEKSRLLESLGKLMIATMANGGDTSIVAEDAKIKIAEYNHVVNKLEPKVVDEES